MFEEKLGLGNLKISVMSSCVQNVSVLTETKSHRLQIPPLTAFAERFLKAPFPWRLSVRGRSNRRNNAAFSDFFRRSADAGHQLKKGLLNLSVVIWQRRTQCMQTSLNRDTRHALFLELVAKLKYEPRASIPMTKLLVAGKILSIPFCSMYKGLYFYFPTIFSARYQHLYWGGWEGTK